MSEPADLPLKIYRGDSKSWAISLFTDVDNTIPYPITGQTVKAQIREKSSAPVLAELDCTTEEPNIVHMVLTAEKSKKLRAGTWRWDLQFTEGTEVHTLLAGDVVVTPDITDS